MSAGKTKAGFSTVRVCTVPILGTTDSVAGIALWAQSSVNNAGNEIPPETAATQRRRSAIARMVLLAMVVVGRIEISIEYGRTESPVVAWDCWFDGELRKHIYSLFSDQ